MAPEADGNDADATTRLASPRFHAGDAVELVFLPERGRTSYLLKRGTSCTIGRAETCDVLLAERSISRVHARIALDETGIIQVEDLASANGTGVAGTNLSAHEAVMVYPGDFVRVGAVYVVLGKLRLQTRRGSARIRVAMTEELATVVSRIADASFGVLVCGEPGVGKSALAERLHTRSARADRPLVSLSANALETQLASPGFDLVARVDGGTLVVGDVDELSSSAQERLARAITPAFRVVATTTLAGANEDPTPLRKDLLAAIADVTVEVPPLRDRVDEIEGLARTFLVAAAAKLGRARAPILSRDARIALEKHTWPGNVAELKRTLDAALATSDADVLGPDAIALVGTSKGP